MAPQTKPLSPAEKAWISRAYQAAQGLQTAGRLGEAKAGYRAILLRHPAIAEAHFQIARIELAAGRLPDARAAAEAALRLRPREEALWHLLADIARNEGHPPPAALTARARKAGLPDAALARIAQRFDLPPAPLATPDLSESARPHLARAEAALRQGDEASALRHLDKALARAPSSLRLKVLRADTLLTLGDRAAAAEDARDAVMAEPRAGYPWTVWAKTRKVAPGDPLLAELERQHQAAPEGGEERRQMAYALAKAMEDLGEDDRFFAYLNEANALTARRFPFSRAEDLRIAESARVNYTPELVRRWAGASTTAFAPIFVTGLPRSGTTLIEQILASHPQVTGGGELAILGPHLLRATAAIAERGPEAGGLLAEAGRAYAAEVARRHPGKAIVTDKSISTYVQLGYVPLALPKAKIIVVRREPRDSCLALLKQRFADGMHRSTYTMEDTAGFYRIFATQVAFWREAAPEAFIEVWYEDVVADLEGQARRMVEWCGLPWDEACLDFHRNDRAVKTLSTAQVRQPIYASSVGAWKRYEKHLGPLLAALGPVEDLP